MQDYQNLNSDDEISVGEVFITLWAYKFLIACTIAIGIICSGYYLLNTEKKFTSTATFELSKTSSTGIKLPGELSAIASLAGVGSISPSVLSRSQVYGRIFIKKIDYKVDLQSDPFFNSYDPEAIEPVWRSAIKYAIGWHKSSKDMQEIVWQEISRKYLNNVVLKDTDDGAIKVEVTHLSGERAATIANAIMEEIIFSTKQKSNTEQDSQLSYLSRTLAKALSDLEISQSNLKAFALENSALPLENFTIGSMQLDTLRGQLSRTTELYEAVAELSHMLKNNSKSQADYLSLRNDYPIIDQVEFRRVLGQNEITSSWSWPKLSTVSVVLDTLSERKKRLDTKINTSQINAQRSSQALEVYARLEREAKIAEATYTVLIEQVKAQSMAAGYRPRSSEIFEFASTSINPSAPNTSIILVLGAFCGLFIGSVLALFVASTRNVFYSQKSLTLLTNARLSASSRTLNILRNKSLVEIDTRIKGKQQPILRDISVEIHKNDNSNVIVTSSRAKLSAYEVALALAITMQSEKFNIAVIDFSRKRKKESIDLNQPSVKPFVISETMGQVSILKIKGDLSAIELVSQKEFLKTIQHLNSNFNLVFLCADNENAISLLRALEGQKIFHLSIARTKHTKSDTLLNMHSLIPIQGLLHD